MSFGSIFCPVCGRTIQLDLDYEDLIPGFSEDATSCCQRCGATFSTPVTMDVSIGKPRMIGGPIDEKWLTVQNYYRGRKLENRLEAWSFSPSNALSLVHIMRDEIWAKTTFQGIEFVTDGYTALRVPKGVSFSCVNDNSEIFSSFLQKAASKAHFTAQIVARIVGADIHCDHVEDYAALKRDDGLSAFFVASHVESFLAQYQEAKLSLDDGGDFAVVKHGNNLCGIIAALAVDGGRFDKLSEFLGGAA